MKVIHPGASSKMLGSGMATVTNSAATAIPIRFAAMTTTVRISWMRIRRRRWLSETRPSSKEPYAGVSCSRPL
jgi:hypothetical protein